MSRDLGAPAERLAQEVDFVFKGPISHGKDISDAAEILAAYSREAVTSLYIANLLAIDREPKKEPAKGVALTALEKEAEGWLGLVSGALLHDRSYDHAALMMAQFTNNVFSNDIPTAEYITSDPKIIAEQALVTMANGVRRGFSVEPHPNPEWLTPNQVVDLMVEHNVTAPDVTAGVDIIRDSGTYTERQFFNGLFVLTRETSLVVARNMAQQTEEST